MRDLAKFLVHLFGRDGDLDRVYLSTVHDRCLLCEEPISESPAYLTYRVCPFCRFHYTLTARERIDLLADKGTFKESHKYLSSVDPLSFSRRGRYRKLISQDQNRKAQDRLQKTTDGHTKAIDEVGAAKETEIMQV
ncbi:MAG: hypothetical protein AAB528_02850 [Chloroflexota bacterium]